MSTKTDEQRAAEWEARIDIREPVKELARRLALPYEGISEIIITPDVATVTLFKRNDNGSFYVDQDTGKAASETHTLEVIT